MKFEVLMFVLMVVLFTSLGGVWVARRDPQRLFDWLPYVLSLGTGILLTLAITEFIPHSFEGNVKGTSPLILLGILSVVMADKYLAPLLGPKHKNSCTHHSHGPQMISKEVACSSVGCIIVCAFFDGIEIQTAFNIGSDVGWYLALGLFFHVVPEGAIVAGLSLAGGFSSKAARRSVLLIATSMILGAIVGALSIDIMNLSKWVLPFASGVLLYVSIGHLLPIALKKRWGFIGLLVGSGFIQLMSWLSQHKH